MNFKEFAKYVLIVVVSTIATIGTIIFLFIFFINLMVSSIDTNISQKETGAIKSNTVLRLMLDKPIREKQGDPFEFFDPKDFQFKPPLTLHQMLQAIEEAARDDKIKGIVIQPGMVSSGMVITDEIREALKKFKESGKFVIAYAPYYSQTDYMLSSVADSIYLHPLGTVDWRGMSAQILFYKKALESLGINMQVIRHGKFKSAVEPFMQDKMSEANREQHKHILKVLWEQMLENVSQSTGLKRNELDELASGLKLQSAEDVWSAGMITDLATYPDLEEMLQTHLETDKINWLDLEKYYRKKKLKNLFKSFEKGSHIAVLVAEGEIVDGVGEPNQIGSISFINQIRKLKDDDDVKGVVLRINSPGGSALASEEIWNELMLLKEEKPLAVSMGNVAASGGYYIAVAGDKIFTHPMTITGSIGVFGLIPDISGLMKDKLKINVDTVKTHPHADMGIFRPLDETEKNYIQNMIEHTYTMFLERVADGRGMSVAQVDSIGQGRVWTGVDALRLGLADSAGGLKDAIAYMAEETGLDENQVRFYPKSDNPFFELFSMQSAEEMLRVYRDLKDFSPEKLAVKSIEKIKKMNRIQARMPYQFIWN